jgi:hypothetical protein
MRIQAFDHLDSASLPSSSGGIAFAISSDIPNSSTRMLLRSLIVISVLVTVLSEETTILLPRPTITIERGNLRQMNSASLNGERLRSLSADRA